MKVAARVPEEIARLDVATDMGSRVLAERTIRGSDFREEATYEAFRLSVQADDALTNVEFRAHLRGGRGTWLDRINLYPERLALEAVTAACPR